MATATAADDSGKRRQTFLWVFGITMVLTAGTAFAFKLIEFYHVATTRTGDGLATFLIPVLTYLIVASGFACLFVWAYLRGQFTDVEAAKYRMLEMQRLIDQEEARAKRARRQQR